MAAGLFLTLLPLAGRAGLAGGPHDFSALTGGHSCEVCHIPHVNSIESDYTNPKWHRHSPTNSTYVTYDQGNSATFKALNLTVQLGTSVACLSCHDGSMAVNQSYAGSTAAYAPTFAIETASATYGAFDPPAPGTPGPHLGRIDLTHMHPVGVSYTQAAAADPTLRPIGGARSLLGQMLKGARRSVECSTCHDIHGILGDSGRTPCALIVSPNNAALCETCHLQ